VPARQGGAPGAATGQGRVSTRRARGAGAPRRAPPAAGRGRPGAVARPRGRGARAAAPRSELWLDEALSVNIAASRWPTCPTPCARTAPRRSTTAAARLDRLFGTSDVAVRALSLLVGLLACRSPGWPGAGCTRARRLGRCPAAGPAARSPCATPTRRACTRWSAAGRVGRPPPARRPARPRPRRLAGLSVVAAALALTHYWALFLLAVVGAGLLSGRSPGPPARAADGASPACSRAACSSALAAGLPVPVREHRHAVGPAPRWVQLLRTFEGWSGPGLPGALLGLALLVLVLAAPFLRPGPDGGWCCARRRRAPPSRCPARPSGPSPSAGRDAGCSRPGYAVRYSAVALVPALLAVAVALQAPAPRAPHRRARRPRRPRDGDRR
jgi:hypothetical protein